MELIKVGSASGKPIGNASKQVEELLKTAFAMGLEPEPVPGAKIVRFTVTLTDDTARQLKTLAQTYGCSHAVMSAQLIRAVELNEQMQAEDDGHGASKVPAMVGLDAVRPILRATTEQAWQHVQNGKIVFTQASTGTGKGRMLASLAVTARRTLPAADAVVLAAPLTVVKQLIGEITEIDAQAKICLILGRNNFVDPVLLQQWVEAVEQKDAPLVEPLRQWIQDGGKPITRSTIALTGAIRNGQYLAWLVDDAISLCEDLPLRHIVLDDDAEEGNSAEAIYRMMRDSESSAGSIIFCSQTMVAADTRLRMLNPGAGILPETIGLLLVDEAHELEKAFSSVFSQSLHLSVVPRYARKAGLRKPISEAIVRSAEDLIALMQHMHHGSELPKTGPISSLPHIEALSRALLLALRDMPRMKRGGERNANRKALRRAADILEAVVSGYSTVHLSVSPIQTRPIIMSGRANLAGFFAALWDRVHCAVLTSATLYAHDGAGELTGKYSRWILSVPEPRAVYLPEVRPAWIIESVRLHQDYSGYPPDDSDEWHDQTSDRIFSVARQAAGGVLVLCTSYHTVAAIAGRLENLTDGTGLNLIVQSPYKGASVCANEMRVSAQQGKQSIWLGVGAAWTGVDLSDSTRPAAEDLVLTDLIIPRIPLGVNRTLTHMRRCQLRNGFMIEAKECTKIFAQGIGRLVRREGVLHRKLWVFDARIGDPKCGYVNGIRRVLEAYNKGG